MAKYQDKPVVIDGTDKDDDAARLMHPDRQQGFIDALTELCRQWGMRPKNIQSAELTALSEGLRPDGKFHLTHGRLQWLGPNGEKLHP